MLQSIRYYVHGVTIRGVCFGFLESSSPLSVSQKNQHCRIHVLSPHATSGFILRLHSGLLPRGDPGPGPVQLQIILRIILIFSLTSKNPFGLAPASPLSGKHFFIFIYVWGKSPQISSYVACIQLNGGCAHTHFIVYSSDLASSNMYL